MRNRFALLAGTAALVAGAPAPATRASADLRPPTGYRTWFHVNSAVVDSASGLFKALGGLHNIYLNAVGQPALASGGPYPAGATFVDDIHALSVSDHIYTPGARIGLAVMVRDPKEYAATGGWGFQLWAGGDSTKPLVTNAVTQCYNCHTQRKDNQFVFSTYIP